MSEMSTVEAVWHAVFNRGFTRDNASMVNAVVASALVLCHGFMSSRRADSRRAERAGIGTPDAENSLISFEQWLLDERREYMAMIHLLQTPPYRNRATFLQMVAVLVGHGRMALNFYKAHNCDAAYGRSIRGFSRWLRSGGDAGARKMMLDDLLDEVRLTLQARYQVGEEGEQGEEGEEGEVPSAMTPVAQTPLVEQGPRVSASRLERGPDILHDNSTLLAEVPHPTPSSSTAAPICFRYEVTVQATSAAKVRSSGDRGNTEERHYPYGSPLESVQLVVTLGKDGTLSCSLTDDEGAQLRTLHERVAERLYRNVQRVLPSPYSSSQL